MAYHVQLIIFKESGKYYLHASYPVFDPRVGTLHMADICNQVREGVRKKDIPLPDDGCIVVTGKTCDPATPDKDDDDLPNGYPQLLRF